MKPTKSEYEIYPSDTSYPKPEGAIADLAIEANFESGEYCLADAYYHGHGMGDCVVITDQTLSRLIHTLVEIWNVQHSDEGRTMTMSVD